MTDCSEELLAYWRGHQYLAEFSGAGILEFELLQAGAGNTTPLKPATGPLVVIANYVFDSLPQDAFVINNGELSEALVAVPAGGNSGSAASLDDVQLSFTNAPVPAQRYQD